MRHALAILVLVLATSGLRAQTSSPVWLGGEEFQRKLDLTAGVTWSENPVRSGVARLSRTSGTYIWLDRRIDPGFTPEFECHGTSLDVLLKRLAAKLNGGVGYLESVVYLGPVGTARKLPTLVAIRRDEIQAASKTTRERLLARAVSRWEDLAVPRALATGLANEAGVVVDGLEKIPHDLWPAAELPALPWVDRMSLVLSGFDLTFEIAPDGSAARIVPMPPDPVLIRTYPVRGDVEQAVEQLAERFPRSRLQPVGKRLQVAGAYEDHRLIKRLLQGKQVQLADVPDGNTRYSLRYENQPLGGLVQGLARQLDLELSVGPGVTPLLHERVHFQVKEATLEELLEAALKESGIRFELQGTKLTLTVDR